MYNRVRKYGKIQYLLVSIPSAMLRWYNKSTGSFWLDDYAAVVYTRDKLEIGHTNIYMPNIKVCLECDRNGNVIFRNENGLEVVLSKSELVARLGELLYE